MNKNMFKNCNIIYVKSGEDFFISQNLINSFSGKIIADNLTLSKECYIKGIPFILNINPGSIPNEKIDCIVVKDKRLSHSSNDLEAKVLRSTMKIPIIYIDSEKHIKWCPMCNLSMDIDDTYVFSKYCSEKCMKKYSGFTEDFKPETVKDLEVIINKQVQPTVTEVKKTTSKSNDKFQTSVIKDAIRLEYAFKRESYKKEMRQPSLRKASFSNKKVSNSKTISQDTDKNTRTCVSITKKGKKCTNKAIGNSMYCGIISHMMEDKKT